MWFEEPMRNFRLAARNFNNVAHTSARVFAGSGRARNQERALADRLVALVTGASSGIGFATASLLATRGYRTFGTSRRPQGEGGPKGVEMVQLDVRSNESARSATAEVLERAGRIDILVNNAGFGLFGAIEETSL